MGTRGAIGFVLDGEEKITYNHFDSYPSELGSNILEFLQSVKDMTELQNKVHKIELIKESNEPTMEQIQQCIKAKTVNTDVSEQSYKDWYCLLREAQGDLGKFADVGLMIDSKSFLKDSLFCEWAYIINFDTSKFEIYRGFNKNPDGKGRYASNHLNEKHRPDPPEYYGVELIYEADLYDLPESLEEDYDEDTDKNSLTFIYGEDWKNVTINLE